MSSTAPVRSTRNESARPEGVAASAWTRPLVAGAVQGVRVVGVSGPACYVRVAQSTVIAVEAVGGARLPNAVTVDPAGCGLADIAVGAGGCVGEGMLRIGTRTLIVRRWWDPHPRTGRIDTRLLRQRRSQLPTALAEGHDAYGLGGPIARLRTAAVRRNPRAVRRVVAELIGRGPGSTPAGDDVLAGLLATLRVCADPRDRAASRFADAVARETGQVAHRTTSLSSTLLRCADDGAVVESARRVLRALAGHGHLASAVASLAAVGHTSGRDLLTGIAIAVDMLATERQPS